MKRAAQRTLRRVPVQSRSRDLVDAVVAAGLDILERGGAGALTVRAICERAGVSAGSVYQYFDTKEAVVAAVYRGQLEREWKLNLEAAVAAARTLPLEQAITLAVEGAVERQLRLYELHPEFYRDNAHQLLLGGGSPEAADMIAEAVRAIINDRRDEFRVRHVEYAIFVLVNGLNGLFRETLRERPHYLQDRAFVREMVDLVRSYLLADSPSA